MVKKIIPVAKLVRLEAEVHRIRYRSVVREVEPLSYVEGYALPMDIRERARDIVVEMEMPGVLAQDVVILVHHHRLEVRGLKKQEPLPLGGTYLRMEREYGLFRRVIDLPASIQPEKARASLHNGILVITLKKPEDAKDRV